MLAKLKNINKKTIFTDKFYGISERHIEPFSIKSTENICSDKFPAICSRKSYFPLRQLKGSQIFSGDELLYVKDNTLYATLRDIGKLSPGKKCIARFHKQYIIMPDKLMYDNDFDTLKPLEASFSCTQINIGLADEFAQPINPTHISAVAPTRPSNGDIWLDTSTRSLKRFVEYQGIWNTIESIYTVLYADGIDEQFHKGDGISIEGTALFDQSFIIENIGKGYITVLAKGLNIGAVTGDICIKREVPLMHEMCAWQGRLWGINKEKCELYASKLGNPLVFNAFSGLASDSYALQLESTPLNLIAFEDELLVFFADKILRITGNRPSNFRTTLLAQRGLKLGCEHSAVAYRGAVYFISDDGVYRYNSMFTRISENSSLSGMALGFRGKYYVFSQSGIYSYDISNAVWYKESPYIADFACVAGSHCYFLSQNMLYSMVSEDIYLRDFNIHEQEPIHWSIETHPFSLLLEKSHRVSRLGVNMKCEGSFKFEILQNGAWLTIRKGNIPQNLNISVNIALPHIHETALRISGEGKTTIYSITQDILI